MTPTSPSESSSHSTPSRDARSRPTRVPLRRGGVLLPALLATLAVAVSPPISAQDVDDPVRLAGIDRVDLTADAAWDELITTDVGGATEAQFLEALRMTFAASIGGAEHAPTVLEGAPVTVRCHVDTFYDSGLIIYALRVQTEEPGPDGLVVATWVKSWVGSFTVQQLHQMFRLGEQCAESFLEDWRGVN